MGEAVSVLRGATEGYELVEAGEAASTAAKAGEVGEQVVAHGGQAAGEGEEIFHDIPDTHVVPERPIDVPLVPSEEYKAPTHVSVVEEIEQHAQGGGRLLDQLRSGASYAYNIGSDAYSYGKRAYGYAFDPMQNPLLGDVPDEFKRGGPSLVRNVVDVATPSMPDLNLLGHGPGWWGKRAAGILSATWGLGKAQQALGIDYGYGSQARKRQRKR